MKNQRVIQVEVQPGLLYAPEELIAPDHPHILRSLRSEMCFQAPGRQVNALLREREPDAVRLWL